MKKIADMVELSDMLARIDAMGNATYNEKALLRCLDGLLAETPEKLQNIDIWASYRSNIERYVSAIFTEQGVGFDQVVARRDFTIHVIY